MAGFAVPTAVLAKPIDRKELLVVLDTVRDGRPESISRG